MGSMSYSERQEYEQASSSCTLQPVPVILDVHDNVRLRLPSGLIAQAQNACREE